MNQLPQNFDPALFNQPMNAGGGGMLSAPTGQTMTGGMAMNPQFQMMGRPMAPQMAMMGGAQMANQAAGNEAATETTTEKGWWDTFGDIDWGTGLATAGTIAGALDSANKTTQTGHAMQDYLTDLGSTLNDGSQFQGYGVSTGLGEGSVKYDDQGKLVTNLGMENPQDSAAALNSANAFTNSNLAMTNAMADPSKRQGEIYNQMMAAQRPELDRMQAEQQAQEYSRGRGGVRGSQYGGTAEDAAMARARVQGSNEAQMGAMKQADAERGMFGQMAGQFGQSGNQQLAASFLPMQQQIEAMKLGMGNADMAQTGQLTGQDYMAQLGLGGANANINAQHSANQLTGNLYNALLSNLGGTQGSDGSAGSGLMGLLGDSLGTMFGLGDR